MWEISKEKLKQAAKYLDETPKVLSNVPCKDEYWRQLINALPQRIYTNVQIETFAEELYGLTGSPAIKLLLDLRERGLEYEAFLTCLEKIKCYGALNLFVQSTVPVVTLQPQDQMVRIGDALVLKCCAQCVPSPPEYQWHWNSIPLPDMRNPVLKIDDVHANSGGEYACKVTNKLISDHRHNHVWTHRAKVVVDNVKFPIPESGGDDLMDSDSTMPSSAVPCYSTSDTSLQSGSGISLVSRSARGSLVHVPQEDSSGDIEILKHPSDTVCHYNEDFYLNCQAQSKQGRDLKFTWRLEKQRVNREQMPILKTEVFKKSSMLSHRSKKHETLVIFCEVSHADDNSREKVVSEKAKVSVETIWIVEQPKPIDGFIGESASLYCRAEGKGPIQYSWLKSNKDSKKDKIPGYNRTGIFEFPKLEENDWGSYTCQAENNDHFVSSQTVSVKFGTRSQQNLSITVQPVSFVCERGKPATLTCRALPERGTTYQWFFNETPMSDRISSSRNSELVFESVNATQFGQYRCVVRNGGDTVVSRMVSLQGGKNPLERSKYANETHFHQARAEYAFTTENELPYARGKIALLVGNQSYDNIKALTSPHNDVLELKKTLIGMDFKVFAYFDLNYKETMELLDWITNLLGPGMYLFFYYSGHGFHYKQSSTDYIMPVDASSKPLNCGQCLSSKLITKRIQQTLCKAFMFFDCCRVSYETNAVKGPNADPIDQCAYSNLCKILSCSAQRSAYEKNSEACSVFNKALREGLSKKLNAIKDLGPFISEVMQSDGQTKGGKEFQRPETNIRMLPITITLHEEIMRDTWKTEQKEEIPTFNYAVSKELVLSVQHLAKAYVTISYNAINQIRVVTKPRNTSQCKNMTTDVILATSGVCRTKHETVDGTDFCINGIQRITKDTLKFDVVLSVTSGAGIDDRKSETVEIPLGNFPYKDFNGLDFT